MSKEELFEYIASITKQQRELEELLNKLIERVLEIESKK